jgi:hypothetical protein
MGSDQYGQLGTGIMQNSVPTAVLASNGRDNLNLLAAMPSALVTDADTTFTWAETTYGQFFAAGPLTRSLNGYRYRAYAGGQYLAVNESGTPHLYYLGPLSANSMMDLGLLSTFLGIATGQ